MREMMEHMKHWRSLHERRLTNTSSTITLLSLQSSLFFLNFFSYDNAMIWREWMYWWLSGQEVGRNSGFQEFKGKLTTDFEWKTYICFLNCTMGILIYFCEGYRQDQRAGVGVALGEYDRLLLLMGGLASPSSALAPETGGITFQKNSGLPGWLLRRTLEALQSSVFVRHLPGQVLLRIAIRLAVSSFEMCF